LPKVELALQVMDHALEAGGPYLLGAEPSLADFFFVPCTYSLSLTNEGKALYPKFSAFRRWRETMEALPSVQRFRASQPPRGLSSTRENGPTGTDRNTEPINVSRKRALWGRACGGTLSRGISGMLRDTQLALRFAPFTVRPCFCNWRISCAASAKSQSRKVAILGSAAVALGQMTQ
jgi:hypothetical protein